MAATAFRLTSEAFGEGEFIPRVHSAEAEDQSPPLRWSHAPDDTRSFVLRVIDPDAPSGPFTHWVLFDIPPERQELDRGESNVGLAGRNDFEGQGWGGPLPPPGHGDHRYVFTLSALDVSSLSLDDGARRDEVERAMQGHVLDETTLMGRYRRD